MSDVSHAIAMTPAARTLRELRASGYCPRSVRDEMRANLLAMIARGEPRFPGIVGYDLSVIPQIEHAILARHNMILLGLRGQAKTRILRSLFRLLDEWIPVIAGTPLNDDPFNPLSPAARRLVAERGEDTPIAWLHRSQRYNEKLATPDVTVADLIGDLDPMRMVNQRLSLDDEGAIHFGIIPRSNRGIFAVNELPDLQARIQVALLNILEEGDIQIRGFPLRLPLDVALVFTANPEDYTNRGSIITPLKDRIDAQILTHYPRSLEDSWKITDQEAWQERQSSCRVQIPEFLREVVEQVAFEARKSEYVDQNSGVSARVTIALLETLYSAVERRLVRLGAGAGSARIADLYTAMPAITGKIELVYKGEQEGVEAVAAMIIGLAVKTVFTRRVLGDAATGDGRIDPGTFRTITGWFEQNHSLDLSCDMNDEQYARQLASVPGLEAAARQYIRPVSPEALPAAMEFVLEGLYQHFMLSKQEIEGRIVYVDSLRDMMRDDKDDESALRGLV